MLWQITDKDYGYSYFLKYFLFLKNIIFDINISKWFENTQKINLKKKIKESLFLKNIFEM